MSGGVIGTGRVALATVGLILLVGTVVTAGAVILAGDGTGGPPDDAGDPATTTAGPEPVDPPDRPTRVSDDYARLHEAGITGDGVRVGVVDVTGFDATAPRIRDQVRETRSFGDGGGTAHGTAAAAIVSRVAPGADLYLATFDSPGDFERAISWLVAQDVDVIVAPVSFYGQADDGSAAVSRAVTRASQRGIVVVASVGNLADGHWEGRYDDVENGTLLFADPADDPRPTRNYVRGDTGDLTLWLSWNRTAAKGNYTAVLYRRNATGATVVARSRPYPAEDAANERIVTEVGDGRYFVVVRGPDAPTGDRIELTSPTHDLVRSKPRGSIAAPATARLAIGVGAYDRSRDAVAEYSSRGPTADGRVGVDVVAPGRFAPGNRTRLVGSSAAAPYVAGVVALVLQVDPAAPPGRVEAALELTAVDAGRPGVDLAAGHGLVAPVGAVGYVSNRSVVGNASDSRRVGGGDRRPGHWRWDRHQATGKIPILAMKSPV